MDANPENNSRWDEIKRHWFVENVWLWLLPGLFMGGILGYLIGIRSTADLDDWFISGIWPEILSTCVAVALIYRLDRWRDNVRETQRLKRDLLWQVKSRSNEMAIGAIDRLRYEGWLEGENGLLAGADLSETNLAQANLNDANLKGTDFTGANLEGATFIRSELENSSFDLAFLAQACLYNADMSNASIWKTDLTGAKFQSTKAIGTRIRRSNLGDAFIGAFTDFEDADLSLTNLANAIIVDPTAFKSNTTMPDGKLYSPEDDLSRFTDVGHKDFERNEWNEGDD